MLQHNDTEEQQRIMAQVSEKLVATAAQYGLKIKAQDLNTSAKRQTRARFFNFITAILWGVDTLQLIALAQPPESESDVLSSTANGVFAVDSVRFSVLDFGTDTYVAVFALVCVVTWGLMLFFGVKFSLAKIFEWDFSWIVNNLVQPFVELVFMPIFSTLLGSLACSWDESTGPLPIMKRDPSIVCYTGRHMRICTIALVTLLFCFPALTFFRSDPSTKVYVGRVWFLRPVIILSDLLKLILIAINNYYPRESAWALLVLSVCTLLMLLYSLKIKQPACHLKWAFFLKFVQMACLTSISAAIIIHEKDAKLSKTLAITVPVVFLGIYVLYFLYLLVRGEKGASWHYDSAVATQTLLKDRSFALCGEDNHPYGLSAGNFLLIYNQAKDEDQNVIWGHNLSSRHMEDFIEIPLRSIAGVYRDTDEMLQKWKEDLQKFQENREVETVVKAFVDEWIRFLLDDDFKSHGRVDGLADIQGTDFESDTLRRLALAYQNPQNRRALIAKYSRIAVLADSISVVTVDLPAADSPVPLGNVAQIALRTLKLAKVSLAYAALTLAEAETRQQPEQHGTRLLQRRR
eukprot:TRINITY_DN4560_c0_g1_i1.p1 TRINITY_DN4560_c0_g1~~TRINITY_DN4560_c0_g1_i1.p1  ORF type:complete len:650 (-),score=202.85 TRINITY_DN4560_c0_g1_i1:23-1747(-)